MLNKAKILIKIPGLSWVWKRLRGVLKSVWGFAIRSRRHTAVVTAVYAVLICVGFLVINHVSADAGWTQTDWSGGQGTSTTNQYSSQSNLDTTGTSGQAQLAKKYKTATFKGNELVGGSTNLNVGTDTAVQFNTSQEYNDQYFSYDSGDPSKLTVAQDGDYFVSLTMPVNDGDSTNDSSYRDGLQASVYVNGVKQDDGVGRAAYIRNQNGHNDSSIQLAILLTGLSASDYVEVYVQRTTDEASYAMTSDFTLYAEQVDSSETVFNATGTQTDAGTNLNSTTSALQWNEDRKDSGFAHGTGSSSVTLNSSGNYFVAVNVPLSATVQRANVKGRVQLNGSDVPGAQFKQGYIRDINNHTMSSIHWSGIVSPTNGGESLTVPVESEAASGTVTVGSDQASILIWKLPDSGVFYSEATENSNGTDWNPSSKSTVNWATDDITDSSTYTHDTGSNNQDVTIVNGGDYLLSFNMALSSTAQRSAPIATVQVNGTDVTGASTSSTYIRSTSGHNEASSDLLVPLNGLSPGDVVTVSVQAGAQSGTDTLDTPATLMLWQKGYQSSGTLTSAIFDGSLENDWGDLTYTADTPSGTGLSVKVRSGDQPDLSDASDWSSCSAVSSGSDVTSSCAPDKTQYAQYQVSFTGNGVDTATLQDITIGYAASDTTPPPTNASSILAYKSDGGDSLGSNDWANASPYFAWTAGADDGGGSGIKGYCLYLGQDDTADPATTKGLLGDSPVDTGGACQFAVSTNNVDLSDSGMLSGSIPTSDDPYYILVKAIDNADNVYSGSAATFQFRYDDTKPTNPSFITAPSQFVSSKDVTLTWPTSGGDAASDANSGLAGLQYRIGSSGIWYGDSHTSSQDITDLLANDGSYQTQSSPDYASLQEGNNIVYFRTWDNAGNISQAYVTTVIKLNTSSPSSPQNVTASPETNTVNTFSFSWLAPASYTGSASNMTYCYTVNALPSSSNCTYTSSGTTSVPSGAYATQPGENTFYVVAKDEAGNINYATASSTTFTANTAAPGVPLNSDIADISVKSTHNWKLALSWEEPSQTGAGIASYKILRSTDGSTYSQVASTSGTSYVDSGLTQATYYYKVKACDSANNCGALTSAVHDYPTGKFTSPAALLSGPKVSDISTKKATIAWVTDRDSDSKVAIGTRSGNYSSDEIANSSQTVSHNINLTNLTPGTTYYYVAKWTDGDGNTGTSAQTAFTTLPAPSIKDVRVTGVNISTATITFTSSRASVVKLYYGKSDAFGALKPINTSESTSTYSIPLSGLDDGTKYYFKLNTVDTDGNEYDNPQANSFTTPPQPRISNLRFQPVKDQPTSTQQITWTTNVPSTSELSYGPEGQAQKNSVDSHLTTQHKMLINGLADNTVYGLVAQSRDSAGNLATSDKQVFHTALDTRPPKISDLKVKASIKGTGTDASGQIIVSWKTDEPATSQVAYGEGSGNATYNTSTAEDKALVTDHAVVVSNLSTSQIFHLHALSKDSAGNQATSDSRTTIIGNATDSVISIIFNALQKIFGGFAP